VCRFWGGGDGRVPSRRGPAVERDGSALLGGEQRFGGRGEDGGAPADGHAGAQCGGGAILPKVQVLLTVAMGLGGLVSVPVTERAR